MPAWLFCKKLLAQIDFLNLWASKETGQYIHETVHGHWLRRALLRYG
jgi:hypothetical protein